MVNFNKLKKLISDVENKKESEHHYFYQQLKTIAEYELNNKQVNIGDWLN